jgi:sporulation protein YlmC with PRC-barrel domain
MKQLGIDLFIGTQRYDKTVSLTDTNYFSIYDQKIRYNLNPNKDYFQTKEIIQIVYKHIQSIKNNIIVNNPFKVRYQRNNDVCVDIRFTDAGQFNPGAQYYLNTLSSLSFDRLYVSTDDPTSSIITQILQKYPRAVLFNLDEVQSIQFASTCKYVVLSNGSFSAVIGYLAFFSTVYYCKIDPTTPSYGNMFSITGWKEVSPIPQVFGKRFFFNMTK